MTVIMTPELEEILLSYNMVIERNSTDVQNGNNWYTYQVSLNGGLCNYHIGRSRYIDVAMKLAMEQLKSGCAGVLTEEEQFKSWGAYVKYCKIKECSHKSPEDGRPFPKIGSYECVKCKTVIHQ